MLSISSWRSVLIDMQLLNDCEAHHCNETATSARPRLELVMVLLLVRVHTFWVNGRTITVESSAAHEELEKKTLNDEHKENQ